MVVTRSRVLSPTASITCRSGVPMGTSPTPCRCVQPVMVQTIVPGDCSVPSVRNQAAPRLRMRGTLAIVSTLFTSVGAAPVAPVGPAMSTWADSPLPSWAARTSALVSKTSSTPRR